MYTPLIIDHDAAIDDCIALLLQIKYQPSAIQAITIVPADSYNCHALWITLQLKKHFFDTQHAIPIGLSDNEGVNLFPAVWREHGVKLAQIPFFKNELVACKSILNSVESAYTVLEKVLDASPVPVTFLVTGPCTNIAELITARPDLVAKIERLFIMGGALYSVGNVIEEGHDGSAEWNIYNNPAAFQVVLLSGAPITLVTLDATDNAPITPEFMRTLETMQHIDAIRFVYESLCAIRPVTESKEYVFWDTLTSAALINSAIIKTKKVAINVILKGPSMGRTIEDPRGVAIDVAIWADYALFEKTILDVLLKK